MRIVLHGEADLELVDLGEPHLHVEGDAGFGALQMFAAGFALCTASVLQAYAEGVVRAPIDRLSIRVRWSYVEGPYRIGELAMAITWPDLPESRVEAARRAAQTCTIHHTFEHPPTVTTTVSR